MPLIDLIDIKVRKQGALLFEGRDYTIDFDNFVVKFNNKDYNYYNYLNDRNKFLLTKTKKEL